MKPPKESQGSIGPSHLIGPSVFSTSSALTMRVRFKIQRFDVQGTPPLLVPGPKLGQDVVLAPPCRGFFLSRAMLPPSHARSFFSSRCNARFRGGLVKRQVCVCRRSASWGVWDAEFGVLPSSGRFVRADGSFSARAKRACSPPRQGKPIPGPGVTSSPSMDSAAAATDSRERTKSGRISVVSSTAQRTLPRSRVIGKDRGQ